MAVRSTDENQNTASSHYFLGKKPSASASLYLRAATSNQANIVEPLPATKANWSEYERLRLLAWRLRRNAGFAWWVPVLFATAIALLFLLWLVVRTHDTSFYRFPEHHWRVVQNLSPCLPNGSCGELYMIQEVNNGVANPPTLVHFRGPQHFEAGMTFSWIRVTQIGSEFDVDGWDVVRQDIPPVFINGKWRQLPALASNCRFDWSTPEGHVVCEGGKAQF